MEGQGRLVLLYKVWTQGPIGFHLINCFVQRDLRKILMVSKWTTGQFMLSAICVTLEDLNHMFRFHSWRPAYMIKQ